MIFNIVNSTQKTLQRKLQMARDTGNIDYAQRLEAIQLLAWNLEIEQIAQLMQKTSRTIYTWVKLFILKRFEGLKPKSSSGRRGQLNNKEKKQLIDMLQHSPDEHGYPTGVWRAALIQDLIFNAFGVSYSTGYIAQLIKGLGFSHKKALGVCYKADALKQKQWIEETYPKLVKRAIEEGALILWQDESRYQLWSAGRIPGD